MNILIFSDAVWDDTNSFGNTCSNFFDGETWEKDAFYNIYMRNAMPKNNVCSNYYCISIMDMIKNYFHKEKIGKEFIYKSNISKNDDINDNINSLPIFSLWK